MGRVSMPNFIIFFNFFFMPNFIIAYDPFKWLASPVINEFSLWKISSWEEGEQEHLGKEWEK